MHPRIALDPTICHGQPTVRGLRYPVQNVLEYPASGTSEAETLADCEGPGNRRPAGLPGRCGRSAARTVGVPAGPVSRPAPLRRLVDAQLPS